MTSEHTRFTCPDCGGAIERIHDEGLLQYRCRIGHLYSPQSAIETHNDREENTLWSAVVLLEEGAEMAEEAAQAEGAEFAKNLLSTVEAKRALASRVRELAREYPVVATPSKLP